MNVSIIIPVYNAGKYLGECLQSILEQNYPDFEIICINDGSTDNSEDILRQMAGQDSRIKFSTTPNAGAGAARNLGLTKAKGEFVTFVDADDLLLPNALSLLVSALTSNDADIAVGSRQKIYEDANGVLVQSKDTSRIVPDKPITDVEKTRSLASQMAPHAKLIKHDWLKEQDIWFPEGVTYEDYVFSHELYSRCHRISTISDVVYLYRRHNDSVSAAHKMLSEFHLNSRFQVIEKIIEISTREGSLNVYSRVYDRCFRHFLRHLEQLVTQTDTDSKTAREAIRSFANKIFVPNRENLLASQQRVLAALMSSKTSDLKTVIEDERRKKQVRIGAKLMKTVTYIGSVVPGRGRATNSLRTLYTGLCDATGKQIFPGTLNLILKQPVKLDATACVFRGKVGKLPRFFWRARIKDHEVYIYRWRGAPLHVMEIMSDFRLRDKFGTRDGDILEIELPEKVIMPIDDDTLLSWKALWMDREKSFYSSDEVNNITKTVLSKYRYVSTQR